MITIHDLVHKVLKHLSIIYGPVFQQFLAGHNRDEVRVLWEKELAYYVNHPECVDWALEHLPERCPNLIEFRNLCRNAPIAEPPELPAPIVKLNAQQLAERKKRIEELSRELRQEMNKPFDRTEWARRIVAKAQNNEKVAYYTLNMACDVLNISLDELRSQAECAKVSA